MHLLDARWFSQRPAPQVSQVFPVICCRWTRSELIGVVYEFSQGEQKAIMIKALDDRPITPPYKKSSYRSSLGMFEGLVLRFKGVISLTA